MHKDCYCIYTWVGMQNLWKKPNILVCLKSLSNQSPRNKFEYSFTESPVYSELGSPMQQPSYYVLIWRYSFTQWVQFCLFRKQIIKNLIQSIQSNISCSIYFKDSDVIYCESPPGPRWSAPNFVIIPTDHKP